MAPRYSLSQIDSLRRKILRQLTRSGDEFTLLPAKLDLEINEVRTPSRLWQHSLTSIKRKARQMYQENRVEYWHEMRRIEECHKSDVYDSDAEDNQAERKRIVAVSSEDEFVVEEKEYQGIEDSLGQYVNYSSDEDVFEVHRKKAQTNFDSEQPECKQAMVPEISERDELVTLVGRKLVRAGFEKYCKVFFDSGYSSQDDVAQIDFRHLKLMEVHDKDQVLVFDALQDPFQTTSPATLFPVFISSGHQNVREATSEIFLRLRPRFTKAPFYANGRRLDESFTERYMQRSECLLVVLSKDDCLTESCLVELGKAVRHSLKVVGCIVNVRYDRNLLLYWENMWNCIRSKVRRSNDIEGPVLSTLFQKLSKEWIYCFDTKAPLTDQVRQISLLEEGLKGKLRPQLTLKEYDDYKPVVNYLQSKGWDDLIPRLYHAGVKDYNSAKDVTLDGYKEMGVPVRLASVLKEELPKVFSNSS